MRLRDWRHPAGRVLGRVRQPATQTDLVQLAKTVLAAVLAWLVATEVFGLSQPFLAPWTALLTVHATVYRTLSRGVQSVAATGVGVLLSFAVALALGSGTLGLAVALLAGLGIAQLGLLRAEGITVATTALFVLTTSGQADPVMLLERVFDTGIGVVTGMLVNLLVLPPLQNRSAQQRVDDINRKLGGLLRTMAGQFSSPDREERSRSWIERTREIDQDLESAWQVVRQAHESSLFNPRYRLSRTADRPSNYRSVLIRLEEGIAQTRAIARTVDESTRTAQDWDPRFREPWLGLLSETGDRVADPDAEVESLRSEVDALVRDLSEDDLPGLLWPTYGALLTNLSNIIDVVDDVASARPVRT